MPDPDKLNTLEVRIVELENQMKAMRPASAIIAENDLEVYWNLVSKWKPPYRCINECAPGLPCDCSPVLVATSLINQARLAHVAGVLDEKTLAQVTEKVQAAVGRMG